jgi:hypothetical protein
MSRADDDRQCSAIPIRQEERRHYPAVTMQSEAMQEELRR